MDDSERAEAVARWLSERKGEPVRFERVEDGAEEVLEDREQRELDGVPSALDREPND